MLTEASDLLGFRIHRSKLRSRLSMTSWMLLSLSVPVCGEDVEVTERFTDLGSNIHVSAPHAVSQRSIDVWVGPGKSLIHEVCCCQYLCRRTKVRVFKSLVLQLFLYGHKTWTLTKDLRWRHNFFSTRSLQRILGYHPWSDFVSIEHLRERLR